MDFFPHLSWILSRNLRLGESKSWFYHHWIYRNNAHPSIYKLFQEKKPLNHTFNLLFAQSRHLVKASESIQYYPLFRIGYMAEKFNFN